MAGRRESFSRDRRHNSVARKRTEKALKQHQQEQSSVLRRLIQQARAEAKASTQS